MNLAKPIKYCTPEEFEILEKEAGFNYELIDGLVLMSPSPSRVHQEISGNLYFALRSQLINSKCSPIYEMDIKFKENIFRPDMMVFCDSMAEIPEIICEILSPSSRQTDLRVKLVKYEEMGIKEYWIIDPKTKTVTVHDFVNNTAEIYDINDTVSSAIISQINIPVKIIFEN